MSRAFRQAFYITYFLLSILAGFSLSCGGGGGGSGGQTPIQGDSGGPALGPLPGEDGETPPPPEDGGTSSGNWTPPPNPAPSDPVTNVPPTSNSVDPIGGSITADWIALLQNPVWKNHQCRNTNSLIPTKTGVLSALNQVRQYYKLYGRTENLREIVDDFSGYIQDELIPQVANEFVAQMDNARVSSINPATNPQAYGQALSQAIQNTKITNVFENRINKNTFKTTLLTSVAVSGSHPKTGQVVTLLSVHPLPPFQKGGTCEQTCIDFMKEALGTRYHQRWDAYLQKYCSDYPASLFGIDPESITINDPAQIPFGIRIDDPTLLRLRELKLINEWTYDELRRVYLKTPHLPTDIMSLEKIFSSYFGSQDILNQWKSSGTLNQKQYVVEVEKLKSKVAAVPYELYSNTLGPDGSGTFHHAGVGIYRYPHTEPDIGIFVVVFSPETIN